MLLSTIGSSMIWPFLMVYASERLNLPLTQTASLVTINSAASLIMTFAAGQITDRVGRKMVMVVSLLSNAVVYLFLSHAATYTQFAVLMVMLGASNPLYRVGADAMLADLVSPDKRADAYSVLRMSNNAGIAIGPSVGGFLAAASQYLAFYFASAGLFIFGLLILFFAVETLPAEGKEEPAQKKERWGGYDRVLKDWPFITTTINIAFGLITASLMWVSVTSVCYKSDWHSKAIVRLHPHHKCPDGSLSTGAGHTVDKETPASAHDSARYVFLCHWRGERSAWY